MSTRITIYEDGDQNGEIEVYRDLGGHRVFFEVSEVMGVDQYMSESLTRAYSGDQGTANGHEFTEDPDMRKCTWSMPKADFMALIEEGLEHFGKRP